MQTKITLDTTLEHKWKTMPQCIRVLDFNDEAAHDFIDQVNWAIESKQEFIIIDIDSFGGDVYSLHGMLACLRSCKLPIITYTSSKAMSCGAVLFTAGQRRIIAPTAYLMLHQVSSGVIGDSSDLVANAEHIAELNAVLMGEIARNCGKDKTFYSKLVTKGGNADLFVNAEKALKLGLATEIGTAVFNINVKQTCTLDVFN